MIRIYHIKTEPVDVILSHSTLIIQDRPYTILFFVMWLKGGKRICDTGDRLIHQVWAISHCGQLLREDVGLRAAKASMHSFT